MRPARLVWCQAYSGRLALRASCCRFQPDQWNHKLAPCRWLARSFGNFSSNIMLVALENTISVCLHWKKDSHSQNIAVVMMIDFRLPNLRFCGFCWQIYHLPKEEMPIKWACFLEHPHDLNLDYDLSDNGSYQSSNYFFNFPIPIISHEGDTADLKVMYNAILTKWFMTWLSIIAISISWNRVCLRFLLRVDVSIC